MGALSKLVGGGIGLAAEYKASKSPSSVQASVETSPSYDSDQSTDHDEDSWQLDEIQHEIKPGSEALTGEDGIPTEQALSAFFQKHSSNPPPQSDIRRLPAPVILPQRRPQQHGRGFVRAYAPALEGCGIDQDMWMDFLNGFHKAIKMSPAFHVTNVSVGIGALVLDAVAGPSLTGHAVAMAIHISVEASRRAYTHHNTNKYLDSMNDRVFKPRGLYALIMTYKPKSDSADEVIDLNSTITQAVGKRVDPSHRSKFHMSSGKTESDLLLPEAAPLIFPSLDTLNSDEKMNSVKKHGAFLSDYLDRRAQAHFETDHPTSKLNVQPSPEFASRYSDPNHPASQGDLASLVSGGTVPSRQQRRQARRDRRAGREPSTNPKPVHKRQGPMGMLKKQMKENVLYLMVVNLPSEEEMKEVNHILDDEQHST